MIRLLLVTVLAVSVSWNAFANNSQAFNASDVVFQLEINGALSEMMKEQEEKMKSEINSQIESMVKHAENQLENHDQKLVKKEINSDQIIN